MLDAPFSLTGLDSFLLSAAANGWLLELLAQGNSFFFPIFVQSGPDLCFSEPKEEQVIVRMSSMGPQKLSLR